MRGLCVFLASSDLSFIDRQPSPIGHLDEKSRRCLRRWLLRQLHLQVDGFQNMHRGCQGEDAHAHTYEK
jgi:hypothetical protein